MPQPLKIAFGKANAAANDDAVGIDNGLQASHGGCQLGHRCAEDIFGPGFSGLSSREDGSGIAIVAGSAGGRGDAKARGECLEANRSCGCDAR